MSTKDAVKKACRCCAVNFDATICAQCQTAGCAANKRGEKCRLADPIKAAQGMSRHQLEMKYAALKKAYDELLPEAQRLALLVHHYESTALKMNLGTLDAKAAAAAAPA